MCMLALSHWKHNAALDKESSIALPKKQKASKTFQNPFHFPNMEMRGHANVPCSNTWKGIPDLAQKKSIAVESATPTMQNEFLFPSDQQM